MLYFRIFALITIGFIASAGAMTSASAQVAIFNNYYEEAAAVSCPNSNGNCYLYFSKLPQNVLISRAACETSIDTTGAGAEIVELRLGASDSVNGSLRRAETLAVTFFGNVSNGHTIYTSVTPTDFLYGSGKYPQIMVYYAGVGTVYLGCKITGRFQAANQP